MQVGTQTLEQMKELNTYNPFNVDYSQINLDYTNILMVGLAGRLLSPSILGTNKGSIIYSFKARNNLLTQKVAAQSQSKLDKLGKRILEHEINIGKNIIFQTIVQSSEKGLTTIFSDQDNK